MKNVILVSLTLVLVSCGPRRPGKIGSPGLDGQDGYSLVVDVQTLVTSLNITCKRTDIFRDLDRNNFYSVGDSYQNGFLTCDGAVGAKGDKGDQGEAGQDGINGLDGEDGLNGQDGVDGTNGHDGLNADTTYQIVEIIDPCGQQHPNGYDEVILKLGNGKYLASFSDNANGLNTRFGVLKPGSYVTTDGTNCHFII